MKKLITVMTAIAISLGATTLLHADTNRRNLYRYNRLRDEACEKNLHNLYSLLQQYAAANNGQLPAGENYAGLKMLFSHGMLMQQLVCNAARGKTPKKESDLNNKTVSYIYFGGININQAIKNCPKLVLLCDKPDSRHCYALLADGTVVDVKALPNKPKISNCQDIIRALAEAYKYPADVLEAMLLKAKKIDSVK